MKLNYYLATSPGGGKLALTAGWRLSKSSGISPGESKQLYSIMLNDSRLFSFRSAELVKQMEGLRR